MGFQLKVNNNESMGTHTQIVVILSCQLIKSTDYIIIYTVKPFKQSTNRYGRFQI